MLREIHHDVQKLADAIADTLDVDVLVVNAHGDGVAQTHRYWVRGDSGWEDAWFGRILASRQMAWVDGRDVSFGGREPAGGFVGLPIWVGDTPAGVLALIIPPHRRPDNPGPDGPMAAFAARMAELLAGQLRALDAERQLAAMRQERETLMENQRNAYVTTDSGGAIAYYNRRFVELFRPKHPLLGRPLHQVVAHPRLAELYADPRDLRNDLMLYETGPEGFYGFMSCNQVYAGDARVGATYSFRQLDDAHSAFINPLEYQRSVDFNWVRRNLFFTDSVIDMAKRLAVTDKILLITGESGTGKRMLSRCIHNYSDRGDHPLVAIDCLREYRDHVPQTLFGMLGKLQSAHQSTVVFYQIDRLPLSMQMDLVSFLRRPAIRRQSGGDMSVDVRFIFLSHFDLGELVRKGQFSDELYYRICEHHIALPPLRENREWLRRYILSALEYYAKHHGRAGLTLSPDYLDALCRYGWPGNVQEVEAACDMVAFTGSEAAFPVTRAPAPPPLPEPDPGPTVTLSQLERQMIAELLRSGQSKDKMAQALGISRATLYRKIKEYKL